MATEPDDFQLMARAKQDDMTAFRQIVLRHQVPLLNFFRRLGADISRAEDCVQETFIKLYNYRQRYRPAYKFTTFLYTLARHSWSDNCRRQKRQARDATSKEFQAPDATHATHQRLEVQEAINGLSEKLRMTMVLSVYQGLNYGEIAAVLKIPVGTVKSRMSLAFEELRKELGND